MICVRLVFFLFVLCSVSGCAVDVLSAEDAGSHVKAIIQAKDQWANKRGCGLTPDGESALVKKMAEAEPVLAAKRRKFGLTSEQETAVLQSYTIAYLDRTIFENVVSGPAACVLTAKSVDKVAFTQVFRSPDTGTLEVDGSTKGAMIYIDGQSVGRIVQMFVLSVGEHRWRTMRCDETVRIVANETVRRHCDRP